MYDGWYDRLLQHKKVLTRSVLPKVIEAQKKADSQRDALLKMRVDDERKALERHSSNTRMALVGIGITIALSIVQIIIALGSHQ